MKKKNLSAPFKILLSLFLSYSLPQASSFSDSYTRDLDQEKVEKTKEIIKYWKTYCGSEKFAFRYSKENDQELIAKAAHHCIKKLDFEDDIKAMTYKEIKELNYSNLFSPSSVLKSFLYEVSDEITKELSLTYFQDSIAVIQGLLLSVFVHHNSYNDLLKGEKKYGKL